MREQVTGPERRFREMADSVPVLMWLAGTDAGCTHVNARWLAFTGRPAELELGEGWAAGVHPDDRHRATAARRVATERREAFEAEYRLLRSDGAYRWVLDRGVPVVDDDGAFGGLIGGCVDIDERHRAARDLAESRDHLALALAASRMGTWSWDRSSDRVTWDGAMETLCGLPPGGFDGSFAAWEQLLHDEDRPAVLDVVRRALAQGGGYSIEHRIVRGDGEVRWLEGRGEVYRDDIGEVVGIRGVAMDVTDRKAAEEGQADADREARRMYEAERRAHARLAALVAATTSFVWSANAEGALVSRQASWQDYTGQGWDEHRGFGWAEALHPADRARVLGVWDRARQDTAAYEARARLWHAASQTYRHVVARAAPVRDARGAIEEWMGQVTDVHEMVVSAEEHEARAGRLLRLTAALAAAVDEDQIAQVLSDQLVPALGADTFVLAVVEADRDVLRAVRMDGFEADIAEHFRDLDLDMRSAATDAVRADRPVFLSTADEYRALYPEHIAWQETNGIQSWAHVPLRAEGQAVGVVHVGFRHERRLLETERLFIETAAAAAGQAWLRGRTLRAEKASAHRLRQLQEISDIALGRLPLDELLGALLPRLQSVLGVDVVRILLADPGGDGRLREGATLGLDSSGEGAGDMWVGTGFAGRVAERREPAVTEAPGQGELDSPALRRAGVRSLAGVPLLVEDRLVGVLDVGTLETRRFVDADVELLRLAAERIAVAIDRSQAFGVQRSLAQTLQAALLPPSLPEIPGVEVASCYRAAGDGNEVGGDFYDVMPDGRDGWYLVIGDVCGRGVAAATITGLARHTVRVLAQERSSPAAILVRLNDVLFEAGQPEEFATVACARVTRAGDGLSMVLASGGHCLVVVVRAGGDLEEVPVQGALLGAFATVTLAETTVTLSADDAAVFYTDGVLEAKGPDGLFGEERLMTVLAGAAGSSAAGLTRAVEESVLAHALGHIHDDLAILAVRIRPADQPGRVGGRPPR